MKIFFFKIMLISFLLLSIFQSTAVRSDEQNQNSQNSHLAEIEKILLKAKSRDQDVRSSINFNEISSVTQKMQFEIAVVDNQNTGILKSIVQIFTWDILKDLSEEARDAAFLIIQHSDDAPDFQKAALTQLALLHRSGFSSGQDIALLTDRVLLSQGQKQLYGTQFEYLDGELIISPIDDPIKVNDRREELGLISLEEYKRMLIDFYAGE